MEWNKYGYWDSVVGIYRFGRAPAASGLPPVTLYQSWYAPPMQSATCELRTAGVVHWHTVPDEEQEMGECGPWR